MVKILNFKFYLNKSSGSNFCHEIFIYRFQSQNVRDIIGQVMKEQLMGRQYRSDEAPKWAKVIANAVRQQVQELDMKR